MFNFLKHKKTNNPVNLKEAVENGLITEEERLRIEVERAEKNLSLYLNKQKSKK